MENNSFSPDNHRPATLLKTAEAPPTTAMLRNTFCHLPRVGETTEENLWKQGIRTWTDFIRADDIHGIGTKKKPYFDRRLKHAQQALLEGDANYFTQLPSQQHWRVWEDFKENAAFIDIETNHPGNITVLGISDGENVWQFVRHHNMNKPDIKRILSRFDVLVTFNGACFDLPIIEKYFQGVVPDVPHIDLRFAGARCGLSGGLKAIEKELGIFRGEDVDGVTGADALTLWHQYRKTGDEQLRDILLEYNEEDCINLKPLAQTIYDRLRAEHEKRINTHEDPIVS